MVQVRLSPGLAARLKYLAQLEHKTLSELTERALRRYLPSLMALWGKSYTAELPPLEPLPRRRRLDGTYIGDVELVQAGKAEAEAMMAMAELAGAASAGRPPEGNGE
jgi:hypothetical protein